MTDPISDLKTCASATQESADSLNGTFTLIGERLRALGLCTPAWIHLPVSTPADDWWLGFSKVNGAWSLAVRRGVGPAFTDPVILRSAPLLVRAAAAHALNRLLGELVVASELAVTTLREADMAAAAFMRSLPQGEPHD